MPRTGSGHYITRMQQHFVCQTRLRPWVPLARAASVLPLLLLSGCNMVLLNSSGAVASQQSHLIVVSTFLMLLIVVPVIALTLGFAWRYRQSNTEAAYAPDWDHSTQLELVIWAAPLLIIIALGAITWISTHTLDPYRPLNPGHAVLSANEERAASKGTGGAGTTASTYTAAENVRPLVIDVIALDWKWLFIYPEQGIATVNEVAAPVDVPIQFNITASSVMNSFFVPALAGQIYAMPGMQTQLNAVMNRAGDYEGFSANYSGAGFSGMHFRFQGLDREGFDHWIESAKNASARLEMADYQQLAKPSEREPVHRYSAVAGGLYDAILNQCVPSCRK
jgi:cytochrome o ubiquinol oxidase subunit 2